MNRPAAPRRIVVSVGVIVALAALLAGCALFQGGPAKPAAHTAHSSPKPTRTPTAQPTPTPTPTPTIPPPPPPTLAAVPAGAVVAEGDVASPKGSIHFHYRMVSNGDNTYTAKYSNFTSTVPVPISVTLIDVPPQVGDGLTYHGVGDHALGGPTTSAALSSSTPLGYIGNPSYLGTLVTYSSAPSTDGVPVELGPDKVLAVSAVHWSIPARDTNVHPVDSGPAAGAGGQVTDTTPGGGPARYVVAPGDTVDGVAARFGISSQDLIWLNPSGRAFDGSQSLLAGVSLNLDPQAL